MNVTRFTDYSLRVLLYLALRPGERTSIDEITDFYKVSRDHMVKVVNNLGHHGFIRTIRGRSGGIELAQDPSEINIGDVVRKTESNFHIVECFEPDKNQCVVTGVCHLKNILDEALVAFMKVLDRYTLDDVVKEKQLARTLLQINN
jgi:Rrf2 family nitric oxide-sensitive transcriptional repressor